MNNISNNLEIDSLPWVINTFDKENITGDESEDFYEGNKKDGWFYCL